MKKNLRKLEKIMINRDEKIVNEIIKPKDELIQELYKDNLSLHKELSKQANLIEKTEKFEKERVSLVSENTSLRNKCTKLEEKMSNIEFDLKFDYENEIAILNKQHKKEVKKLEHENKSLKKIIENIKFSVHKFISWVAKKLSAQSEDEIIHSFQKETNIFFNLDKNLNSIHRHSTEHELEL